MLEFNLFPLPNILCNLANMGIVEKIIIGLNGLFLPIFFSTVMLKMFGNSFWNRYISFVLNGIMFVGINYIRYSGYIFLFGKSGWK